jgi:hypothetical protein
LGGVAARIEGSPRLRTVVTLALILALPIAAYSQTLDSLRPGVPVRYHLGEAGAAWAEGRYLGRIGDSLRLAEPPHDEPVTVAAADLRDFQVSQGRTSRAGHGALLGAAVGGTAGLAIGIVALSEGCGHGFPDTCIITPAQIAVGAPLILGAVGAGLGALIGAASHRERWVSVAGVGSTITLLPRDRAVTIGVLLRL